MEQAAVPVKKEREYLFDNYKVMLILLVVIGHFIEPCVDENIYFRELKWAIMAFHMPAFIFISGYFSKKIPSPKKLLTGLVIPYFVYEIIYYLLYTYVLHKETDFYFAHPKFSLWYLMALFAWRVITPLVIKIPGIMTISIVGGLLVGLTELDNFLSIPRIFFFFPFFLAGVKFDSSCLKRFRNKKGYLGALGILVTLAVWLIFDPYHDSLTDKIFYGRYSYADMNMGDLEGMAIRLGCYAISFLLIGLFMVVLPDRERPYSYLGQRTMSIYIFHGLVFSCVKYGSDVLYTIEGVADSLLLIVFCVFLVWLLSRKPFVAVTNKIAHLF